MHLSDSAVATALPQTLDQWLTYCESMHAGGIHGIDLGLERVRTVAQRLRLCFDCPVITVAGTNGKGSCCAMLESIYGQAGYSTGVYTSPHLLHFEERCRVGRLGKSQMLEATALVPHFAAVEAVRAGIALTYFEFTTLAILHCLSQLALDVVILEVGLGGRLDAVNVIDADCALITNVDIDHTQFLGNTREAIGFEKAGIARSQKPLILAEPNPPHSVLQHAQEIGAQVWQVEKEYAFVLESQQWLWRSLKPSAPRVYSGLSHPTLRGKHQIGSASGVLAVVHTLHVRLPVSAQAIRTGLAWAHLPGRFQVLPGQPSVVLDVAHNPHAVKALLHNLDAMGFYPATHAVFACMQDKDYTLLLQTMAPVVSHWHFCDLPVARAAKASDLLQIWKNIQSDATTSAHCYSNPEQALTQAKRLAQSPDRIVVFGSFYTVAAVLENINT